MKTRPKRSKIWLMPEQEFIDLIKGSTRLKEVFEVLGIENKGGNFRTLDARIKHLNLDKSHLLSAQKSAAITKAVTLESFKKDLVENSKRARKDVKKYLIAFGLVKYECACCKNAGMWNGKRLSLQLEHKNGIYNDNRLQNLVFLCPNCHSQTDTFAGKNNKVK